VDGCDSNYTLHRLAKLGDLGARGACHLMFLSFRQIPLTAIVILTLLGGTSCDTNESKKRAEKTVEDIHILFNAGQYKEIYQRADQTYKSALTETDSIALFALLRQKLGNVEQSKMVGWDINSSTFGTTVKLQYKTEFTKGNATEQFIFLVSNGDTRLTNYDIQSPLLIKIQ